jgi:hypothetical protein
VGGSWVWSGAALITTSTYSISLPAGRRHHQGLPGDRHHPQLGQLPAGRAGRSGSRGAALGSAGQRGGGVGRFAQGYCACHGSAAGSSEVAAHVGRGLTLRLVPRVVCCAARRRCWTRSPATLAGGCASLTRTRRACWARSPPTWARRRWGGAGGCWGRGWGRRGLAALRLALRKGCGCTGRGAERRSGRRDWGGFACAPAASGVVRLAHAACCAVRAARAQVNIEQQINTSRGEIAYTVLDFGKVEDPAGLQVRARGPPGRALGWPLGRGRTGRSGVAV